MLIGNQGKQLINTAIERIKFLIHGFKTAVHLSPKLSHIIFKAVKASLDFLGPLVNYFVDELKGNFSNCRMDNVFHNN